MRKKIFEQYLKQKNITTDTRHVIQGAIYFALKGALFNGNLFAQQALELGCSMAVVDEPINSDDERIVHVENAEWALQDLAFDYRMTFNIPVLAITGSNGKTTTKELIRDVLAKKFKVHATKGNLNNHIGIPLTILSMPSDTEFAIIEMGANHQKEIASYCQYAQPNFGLITNIGKAHLDGFGGVEGVKKGKRELYDFLVETDGKIFANTELAAIKEITLGMNVTPYGLTQGGIKLEALSEDPVLNFSLELNQYRVDTVSTHLTGAFNLQNIAASIFVGNYFGVQSTEIVKAIEEYIPDNNRSQLVVTAKNRLIMDAYNANPSSMEHALRHLARQKVNTYFIIGDMLELGSEGPDEHRRILKLAEKEELQGMTIGPIFMSMKNEFSFQSFINAEEAKTFLLQTPLTDYLILLKGSRGIAVDKVKDAL